jgi:hypothetical protein
MNPFDCFGLPEVLARMVFVQWLDLKHIVQMDSALCCRKQRVQFASMTYGQLTAFAGNFNGLPDKCVNPSLSWAISKGVRMDGVCICEGNTSTEGSLQLLEKFLAMSGSAIHWVNSYTYATTVGVALDEAVLLVAKWCPNVVHFRGKNLQWNRHLLALTSSFHKLTKLSLDDMELPEQGLAEALRQCVALEHLEVMTPTQVIPIDAAIPTLKSMKSRSCYMSDTVLFSIGQRCKKLETLIMFWFVGTPSDYRVTDVGVRAVLQGCPLLRETDVENATDISTELRVELFRRRNPASLFPGRWCAINSYLMHRLLRVCPNLTELNCRNSGWITDAMQSVCAQHCPQLQKLTLGVSPCVTARGVRALITALGSTLRYVDFELSYRLGDEVVHAIAEHCPLLERFYDPPNASDAAMAELTERCVNLKL